MNLDLSSRQGAAQVPGWKRRWTFLLAATGSAFGLGNIWKLPYIIGENGGGAFVLVFLLCILLIGVPIMMAETLLGRLGRANPVATMGALAVASGRSPNWALAGGLGVAAGLLIMMFYSVVAGWILTYVFTTASGSFEGLQAAAVGERFAQLRDNFSLQLLAHDLQRLEFRLQLDRRRRERTVVRLAPVEQGMRHSRQLQPLAVTAEY